MVTNFKVAAENVSEIFFSFFCNLFILKLNANVLFTR